MKLIMINFIYIFFLLLLESLIVTSLLILFYKGEDTCPWNIYQGHFFDLLTKYFFMKMTLFLIPMTIIFSLLLNFKFKNFYDLVVIKQALVYLISFFLVHFIITIVFRRGGIELGLPTCVSIMIKFAIVYSAVSIAPFLGKLLGIVNLLKRI